MHEHVIYISNFIIKKLLYSSHYYIDGTFVIPNGFRQLIVILYYDPFSKKRYSGLYSLINNKKELGYITLFNSIKNFITLEFTKPLKLKSITIDFEISLINALRIVFPNVKLVGYFYHYSRAIIKKEKDLKIFDINNDKANNMIKSLLSLTFIIKFNDMTKD